LVKKNFFLKLITSFTNNKIDNNINYFARPRAD